MRCPRCDIEYASDAAFCGQCGATLVTATAPAPPQEQVPPAAAHAEAPVRISIFSAVVGLFILGLIIGGLLSSIRFKWWPEPLHVVSHWLPLGLGVAATLWLTGRLQWTGRLLSALSLVLIIMGLLFREVVAYGLLDFRFGLPIAYGLIGLGIGLLVPLVFWRHLNYISITGKVALVFGTVAGLGLVYYIAAVFGYSTSLALPILIALFIGLPSVLISPIVRLSRESQQRKGTSRL
jgi:hypothetical protein